ncbi:MAG: efflux RND transporter permease subunit [Gammaproteobacteria bacterium]|nr:efflux RND transporter permease subunit [Gammaproteobacteria bacterium]NNF67679.1 efflux RND transporter permease subunit [Gammaproteobacteria bacterium]
MIISDLSVRRPVFATVISLLLVILGLAALAQLPVRQYPDIDPPVVSIETTYRGASAEVVETKVTQPIEDRIAGLEGIEKLTSESSDERSDIRIEFSLDRNVDEAANDVRDRVARVVDNLPEEAEPPEIAKVDNDTRAVMYLNLTSDAMSGLELTDYAERFLLDRFSSVPGVARVRVSGARRYAMRIWIDREKLAAHALTVADIESALRAENIELPAGRLESTQREFTMRTDTGYSKPEDFRQLVVGRGPAGQLVRLAEVAEVRIGAQNQRSLARANAIPAVSLGIEQLSTANTVEVSHGVRAQAVKVQPDLPDGMILEVNYDRAEFIEASMNQVYKALGFAILLVLIVIYLFLGSLRATLIPAVVVPVSLIATFIVMGALDYTINIISLLGLVLAIGLVVDDSIIVLENIYRRIEDGMQPLLAALEGAKEIGFAVIATTLVLVSVFVPLSFIQGDVGRLFSEFGISLAAAVIFSSLVALTLTPMMSSRLFVAGNKRSRVATIVDRFFRALAQRYRSLLEKVVAHPWLTLVGAALVAAMSIVLLGILPTEYAPKEDRGVFFTSLRGPEGATLDYTDRYTREAESIVMQEIGDGPVMRVLTRLPASFGGSGEVNSARLIVLLKRWDERDENADTIASRLRDKLNQLPGVRSNVVTPGSLGIRSDGRPVELVLGGPDYEQLQQWRDVLMQAIDEMPELVNADSNYQERKPQMKIAVDRDRAAALGVSLSVVGRTLETMLGSRIVTTYVDRGREYNVVLQGEDADRASPDDLSNLYVRSVTTGGLVPLANLVTLTEMAGPDELNRFDRMRAITIEAGLAEGVSLGAAVEALGNKAREVLPGSARIGWDGESLEFQKTGGSLYITFGLAMMIVFLVLAAQFESFVHPVIIMVTVPLALTGALLGIYLYGSTINVFTQIGAILLIGLAAKNGVLIVEFANQLRDRGKNLVDAVTEAATIRLRPILMTSACTTFGALPLLLASGAGAESRQPIGIVVVFGVAISALLTLFAVPALYALLAPFTRSPHYVSRAIAKLRSSVS